MREGVLVSTPEEGWRSPAALRKLALIYPLVFALYPALALYAHNHDQQRIGDLQIPLLVSLLIALLALGLARLLTRDLHAVAFRAFGMIFCFFASGHSRMFEGSWPVDLGITTLDVGVAGEVAFGFLALAFLFVQAPRPADRLTLVLAVFSFALVVMPAGTIARHLDLDSFRGPNLERTNRAAPVSDRDPHIVYLVVDGYGRADVLQDLFGYDNTPFLDALRARGFYVADAAHANYSQTALSLASSLNMEYLPALLAEEGFGAAGAQPGREVLTQLIEDNRLVRFLHTRGYSFVAFESGYSPAEPRSADHFVRSRTRSFVTGFLALTPLSRLSYLRAFTDGVAVHRSRILGVLTQVPDFVAHSQPVVLLAHVVAPHPPFVFDREGGRPEGTPRFVGLHDGNHFGGGIERYRSGYVEQVRFMNQRILHVIDETLARAARPLIIVVQGDHGPGSRLHHEDPQRTDLRERLAILNAYRFPDGDNAGLYPSITPVNSFRHILSRFFGRSQPLLPDRVTFSRWSSPFQFVRLEVAADGTLRVHAESQAQVE